MQEAGASQGAGASQCPVSASPTLPLSATGHLRVTESGDDAGDELADTEGLGPVGVQRVLQEQGQLLPNLKDWRRLDWIRLD